MSKSVYSKFMFMVSIMASLFQSSSRYKKGTAFQPEVPVHSGGVEIQSYGKRRVYPSVSRDQEKAKKHSDMVQRYAKMGIVWFNNKLYWKDRAYAEANKGVTIDMLMQ